MRVRHALGVRGLYYLAALSGSLRADYRCYWDDWALFAHSGELALELPLSGLFTLGLLARVYTQSAASFYERTYVVQRPDEVPQLRTVDRKLSPYSTFTFGARIELYAGAITAYFEPSAAYSSYADFLYLDQLLALVGQGGLTWAF